MAVSGMAERDEDLLVRSASEPSAFSVFYERHAKDLLRYFAHRTFDPETAADLTAETFAQAFAARGRFRDRGAGAEAWLYTIARRHFARFVRRGRVEDRVRRRLGIPEIALTPSDQERIEELIDFERVGRAVAEALSRLSAEQREALTLRVIDGRPYGEVARILGCTEQAARARVSRGLHRLGAALEI
jgi:RNA polymerase sigma-70 factor (ECF subfamily)